MQNLRLEITSFQIPIEAIEACDERSPHQPGRALHGRGREPGAVGLHGQERRVSMLLVQRREGGQQEGPAVQVQGGDRGPYTRLP